MKLITFSTVMKMATSILLLVLNLCGSRIKYVNAKPVYESVTFSRSAAKPAFCSDIGKLYSSLSKPLMSLISKVQVWSKMNDLQCRNLKCRSLPTPIQIGIPFSYNKEDQKLNEYIGIFKAIESHLSDLTIKTELRKYSYLIESRRNMSYACNKSDQDLNTGKSSPEPWYKIEDINANKCKNKNNNVDCTLMNVLDLYLLTMVSEYKLKVQLNGN